MKKLLFACLFLSTAAAAAEKALVPGSNVLTWDESLMTVISDDGETITLAYDGEQKPVLVCSDRKLSVEGFDMRASWITVDTRQGCTSR